MDKHLEKQTLTIFDEVYTLVSDEPRERLLAATQTLAACMKQLGTGGSDDKKRAIVLCALQVALEYERLKEHVNHVKQKEDFLTALIDRTLVT